jgi:hypothetical protein
VDYRPGGDGPIVEPAGLAIVEAQSGLTQKLDQHATWFERSDGLLLATSWDGEASSGTGMGLAAYGTDGSRRFQVMSGQAVWIAEAFGGRAYVARTGHVARRFLRVVDLSSGRLLGERKVELPDLLLP